MGAPEQSAAPHRVRMAGHDVEAGERQQPQPLVTRASARPPPACSVIRTCQTRCSASSNRHTETVHKGKVAKPTDFGKLVTIENASIRSSWTYEAHDRRPGRHEAVDGPRWIAIYRGVRSSPRHCRRRLRVCVGHERACGGGSARCGGSSCRAQAPKLRRPMNLRLF
jgi:hypothetical protein